MSNGQFVGSIIGPALHLVSLANRKKFQYSLLERAGLVDRITTILGAHNPVALPVLLDDEFRPEAETIAARLGGHLSVGEVRTIVHEEFTNWFDAEMAGSPSRYTEVATAIWEATHEWFLPVATAPAGLSGESGHHDGLDGVHPVLSLVKDDARG